MNVVSTRLTLIIFLKELKSIYGYAAPYMQWTITMLGLRLEPQMYFGICWD